MSRQRQRPRPRLLSAEARTALSVLAVLMVLAALQFALARIFPGA